MNVEIKECSDGVAPYQRIEVTVPVEEALALCPGTLSLEESLLDHTTPLARPHIEAFGWLAYTTAVVFQDNEYRFFYQQSEPMVT